MPVPTAPSSAGILLVEDDAAIVESLSELLAGEGYRVRSVRTQDEAIEAATARDVDLALMDVTLAQGNGFATCTAVKQARPELPVIFLTASGDEVNTVMGIQLGADDYIAKPFRPRELLARIAAAIRRAQPARTALSLGPLSIDPDRAVVERDGHEVELSALEYRLLLFFAANKGRLCTYDMICDALWDAAGTYVERNTVSVYVRRLRAKIEDDPANPVLVTTVRGMGYRPQDEA